MPIQLPDDGRDRVCTNRVAFFDREPSYRFSQLMERGFLEQQSSHLLS